MGVPSTVLHLADVLTGDGPKDWYPGRDQFSDAPLSYSVSPRCGASFTFDASTGEIVSSFRPFRWAAWIALLLTATPFVWGVYRRFRRRTN